MLRNPLLQRSDQPQSSPSQTTCPLPALQNIPIQTAQEGVQRLAKPLIGITPQLLMASRDTGAHNKKAAPSWAPPL